MNWARLPITHFEKWAKVVALFGKSFWKKEEPDFDAMAHEIHTLPYVVHEKFKRKEITPNNAEDVIATFRSAFDGYAQTAREVIGLHEKAVSMLDRAIAKGEQHPTPNGVVVQIPKRLNKIEAEAKYLSNAEEVEAFMRGGLVAEQLIFLHDFNWCGRKVFQVEQQLTDELTLTHVDGVIAEFFRLPFQTICIHFPHNQIVTVRGKVLRWAYVSEYEEEGRHIHVMYVTDGGFPFFHEFIFDSNRQIGPQIREQIGVKYDGLRAAIKENIDAFSLVCSLTLYLNSTDRDVREVKPTVTDDRRDSRIPVCSLGGSIRVSKTLTMSANADGSHSSNTIHILKWAVRGHFRNQAHGEGMKERRLTWIRPYLKGRERTNEQMPMRHMDYTLSECVSDPEGLVRAQAGGQRPSEASPEERGLNEVKETPNSTTP